MWCQIVCSFHKEVKCRRHNQWKLNHNLHVISWNTMVHMDMVQGLKNMGTEHVNSSPGNHKKAPEITIKGLKKYWRHAYIAHINACQLVAV